MFLGNLFSDELESFRTHRYLTHCPPNTIFQTAGLWNYAGMVCGREHTGYGREERQAGPKRMPLMGKSLAP